MISWIVATHDRTILSTNLLATLGDLAGEELIVVEDAPSIAAAYNRGTAQATQPVLVYVHHDVQVLDPVRLRAELLRACGRPGVGMVGVVGSTTAVVPWWDDLSPLGSVVDARIGRLDFGPGGPCAYLDGLLLATPHHVEWDEDYRGWHLYDHDQCQQQLAAGRHNWCLTGGHTLLRHNNVGHPTNVAQLDGWADGVQRFKEKWG
ncbi:MAG TPA: glycosyltransferase [Micromonosporaceae bacterium]